MRVWNKVEKLLNFGISTVVIITLCIAGHLLIPASQDQKKDLDDTITFVIAIGVAGAAAIAFEVYTGYIILRCYRYIKAEIEHTGVHWTVWKTVHRETLKIKSPEECQKIREKLRHY